LDEISLPRIALPKGYQPKEMNLLIQGICNNCK
jgi:Fur family ferric uptake transcriptional regulator